MSKFRAYAGSRFTGLTADGAIIGLIRRWLLLQLVGGCLVASKKERNGFLPAVNLRPVGEGYGRISFRVGGCRVSRAVDKKAPRPRHHPFFP